MLQSDCLCRVKKINTNSLAFKSLVESFECLAMTCTNQPRLHMLTAGGGPAPFPTCVLGYPSQRLFMNKMSHYYMQSGENLPTSSKGFVFYFSEKQNLQCISQTRQSDAVAQWQKKDVQCVTISYYILNAVCTRLY